jgi:UDP-4-amino-4,6-dideoxy-N-acetyl-beta-L-altrosamine transaminase
MSGQGELVEFLPYGRQSIDQDDIDAVASALKSDFLTTGPMVDAFEGAFAQKVGAEHAVSCFNATVGLHMAMLALDLGPGDLVVVPTTTFLSTANCVRMTGADVLFADVDPQSGLMTEQTLLDAVVRADDSHISAIIPVHLRGAIVDMPAIAGIAADLGAAVVEDAAHAVGSVAPWGPVGNCAHSDMAVFSFHPVKTMTTGEGGMVTTGDADLHARLTRLRSHAMIRPTGADPWIYEAAELGFNYRLPDINCALGLAQLAKLDGFVARRAELSRRYDRLLAPHADKIALPSPGAELAPPTHLYSVLIDFDAIGVSRRAVMDGLRAAGIGSQVHYIPVHTQPYYRGLYPRHELPGAEAWYARTLSLPLFPGMADDDPDRVVAALLRALSPVSG